MAQPHFPGVDHGTIDNWDTIQIVTKYADGMYCVAFPMMENSPVFYSRWALWAKAHALQWYADELYRIKKLTSTVAGS